MSRATFSLSIPYLRNFAAFSAVTAALLLSNCSSESSSNPFDVSKYSAPGAAEPFSGTVSVAPDLLDQSSPSTFQAATYVGQSEQSMFDGRTRVFVTNNAYSYSVSFSDSLMLEIFVNSEFEDEATASVVAQRFGTYVGQLPSVLRAEIDELWIHKGRAFWGSGDAALFVHTGLEADYLEAEILEETLVHESVHAALEASHASTSAWMAAQASDNNFISTYAQENPATEDLAESFVMWLAARHVSSALIAEDLQLIEDAIPARLSYFDQQGFNLSPVGL